MVINYYSETGHVLRYKKQDDVGLDLPLFKTGDVVPPVKDWKDKIFIPQGKCATFSTGIHVEFPKDCWGFLKERSSSAWRGLVVLGGVLDPGYIGEIFVMMGNIGDNDFVAVDGHSLAQMILIPRYNVDKHQKPDGISFHMVPKDILSQTDRGDGGFGSTDD